MVYAGIDVHLKWGVQALRCLSVFSWRWTGRRAAEYSIGSAWEWVVGNLLGKIGSSLLITG
jgi:hypothetical protein